MAEPLNIESLKKLPKWGWAVGIAVAIGLALWYRRSSQSTPAATSPGSQTTLPGSTDTVGPVPNTSTPTGSFCPVYATPNCGAGDLVVFERDENGCPKPICGSQLINNLGGPTASGTPIVNASPAPEYVQVCAWPQWCGSLSGIAAHQGISLSTLLAFPNNAQYRANPNLIYAGQEVQVA